jgi:hypothetical protein
MQTCADLPRNRSSAGNRKGPERVSAETFCLDIVPLPEAARRELSLASDLEIESHLPAGIRLPAGIKM